MIYTPCKKPSPIKEFGDGTFLFGFSIIFHRINPRAVYNHTEMKVRPCRIACTADIANGLTFLNRLTRRNRHRGHMRVICGVGITVRTTSVVDYNMVSVALSLTRNSAAIT